MQMISRRERFDPPEAAIFNATREYDMAVDQFLRTTNAAKLIRT
jgi:hypothetical protein